MEALGVAGSIAGLIGLTEVIVFKCSKYCSAVKNARTDIKELLDEVQSLYGVLSRLKLLATCLQENDPGSSSRTMPASDSFSTCRQNLHSLKKALNELDLDSAKPMAAVKIKLTWPFKVAETKDLMEKIARNKRDLSDALSADGLTSLINALSTTKTELAEEFANVQRILQTAEEGKAETEADEHRRLVFDWCTRTDPYQKHHASIGLRHPNTVLWFFDSPEFARWNELHNTTIWLYGIPGAGKTILTSAAIEEAKIIAHRNPGYALAYYYCEHALKQTQMMSNILGSLIKQLCTSSDDAFAELDSFYAKHNPKKAQSILPTNAELGKLLKKLSRHFECVMLIIDGLDECSLPDERNSILKFLSTISDAEHGHIKAMFASREEVDIKEQFSHFDKISIAAKGTDLELFVAAGIEMRIENKTLRLKDIALKGVIIQGIMSKAKGMFQWAKCQLDYLSLLNTDRERREAINTLPEDLFDTYKRILERVNATSRGNKSLVEKALRWLCWTTRPLSLQMLTIAVSIKIGSYELDNDDMVDDTSILRWCSSLVSQDERNNTVSLTHFTVKEFLTDKKLLETPELKRYYMDVDDSDVILTQVCITYLGFSSFSHWGLKPTPKEVDRILTDTPLLRYAVDMWCIHARSHDDNDTLFALIRRFLQPRKIRSFLVWLNLFYREGNWHRVQGVLRSASTLHFAAYFGLPKVCAWLLDQGSNVNMNDKLLGTPLICAIRGYIPWEDWDRGPPGYNRPHLQERPKLEIVRILLKHGAAISANSILSRPPAHFPPQKPRSNGGSDWSRCSKPKTDVTAMSLCLDLVYLDAESGCRLFKELLGSNCISYFANSGIWDKFNANTLPNHMKLEVRQSLVHLFSETLEHPAVNTIDPESKEKMIMFITSYGGTMEDEELASLQAARDGGLFTTTESISKLVVSAAENRQLLVLESLIKKGVKPSTMSKGLAAAAGSGFGDILSLLLSVCPLSEPSVVADVEFAWILACRQDNIENIKVFLDHGVSINTWAGGFFDPLAPKSRQKGTALVSAVASGNIAALKLFLTIPEADFGVITNGFGLMHFAAYSFRNRAELIKLLLEKGVDPLITTKNSSRTVLHCLLSNLRLRDYNDYDTIRLLLEKGCDLHAVDSEGNTLLHTLLNHLTPKKFPTLDDDEREYNEISNILELLTKDGIMTAKRTDTGLLPVQVAVRRRLASTIVEKIIPTDLVEWNSNKHESTPLHDLIEWNSYGETYSWNNLDDKRILRILDALLDQKGVDVNVTISIQAIPRKTPPMLKTPLMLFCSKPRGSKRAAAKVIRKFLNAGANPDLRDSIGATISHQLAGIGNEEGLLECLEHGAKLELPDARGWTPLYHAAFKNQFQAAKMLIGLLEEGDPGPSTLGAGYLPIHIAAQRGNTKIISLLHETGHVPDINVLTKGIILQTTPLHLAITPRLDDAFELLVALGADINCPNSAKETPLHKAAASGRESLVLRLIDLGAVPILEDNAGCMPWVHASISSHMSLKTRLYQIAADYLEKQAAEFEECMDYVDDNNDMNRMEVSGKASAVERNALGDSNQSKRKSKLTKGFVSRRIKTSFYDAIKRKDLAVCRAFLEDGFDPDELLDFNSFTALHLSSEYNDSEMTKLLLEFGASTEIKNKWGARPLHIATSCGNYSIVVLLIDAGADMTARNRIMETPLHIAVERNHESLVELLLGSYGEIEMIPSMEEEEHKAHAYLSSSSTDRRYMWLKKNTDGINNFLDARDRNRRTALSYACQYSTSTVGFLIGRGANIHAEDTSNRNVMWYAAYRGDTQTIKDMLVRGPDLTLVDCEGLGCLHRIALGSYGEDDEDYPSFEDDVANFKRVLAAGGVCSSDNHASLSPLHCACEAGNQELVQELLKVMPGWELEVESKYYGTPLYSAAFRGEHIIVEMLLDAGVNPQSGWCGQSPFDAAKEAGQFAVVEVMLKYYEGEILRRLDPERRLLMWPAERLRKGDEGERVIQPLRRIASW